MNTTLKHELSSYIDWLAHDALSLWSKDGIDKFGASIEQFTASGSVDENSDKRVRVQARQMLVFSAAQQQGWINNGMTLISGIDSFVERFARLPNNKSDTSSDKVKFAHILDRNNNIINANHDLYDIAFFFLGYAWRYHALNDLNALNKANDLLTVIDDDLKGAPGGWIEGNYQAPYRRQNPHMHLFEAFITLYQVTKDGKWLAKAGEIYCLFETKFFDHDKGVLLEFFNDNWQVASDEKGSTIEPGHMMEWVWLLRQYQKVTQAPVDKYCHALYHNALKYGLDGDSQLLFDEINLSAPSNKKTKRCWPMTEWLKASLAQSESVNSDYNYQQDALTAITQLKKYYLTAAKPGQYVDQIDGNNKVCVDTAPASTLYHLIIAGLEAKKFINL
ncbi:MAG: AGE family epimerase/isomerase [Colwellia sp.]